MLVCTVFCDEVADNFIHDWLDLLWWDEIVTRFNDHGEDLTDLVLLM